MSYDLFLRPRNELFSFESFESYFKDRSNYSVEGSLAWYQNEDTGVYFVFEHQDKEENEEEYFPIAFNMNYFRPSFFIREAEPEVTAFISRFDLTVEDPQVNGMGTGEYNSEKLVSGWLYGNEFGYQSILKDHSEVHSLPSSQLEKAWEWNHGKEKLQNEVTDDVFVPSIMLINYQQKIVTACVWPDAIPSIIPPVDILLVGRKELAPRKLFTKAEDMAIGNWDEIQPLLDSHKNKMHGEAFYLSYQKVPEKIKNYIQHMKPIDLSSLERLSFDQVLDRELVEKYAA